MFFSPSQSNRPPSHLYQLGSKQDYSDCLCSECWKAFVLQGHGEEDYEASVLQGPLIGLYLHSKECWYADLQAWRLTARADNSLPLSGELLLLLRALNIHTHFYSKHLNCYQKFTNVHTSQTCSSFIRASHLKQKWIIFHTQPSRIQSETLIF